jgi:hypothetical protein
MGFLHHRKIYIPERLYVNTKQSAYAVDLSMTRQDLGQDSSCLSEIGQTLCEN